MIRSLNGKKNMLSEGNRLKNELYAAKSMKKSLGQDIKKLIYVQTFVFYTIMNIQILCNTKLVNMLGINLIAVEKRYLSHIKN
jgi:hypothetical protein